MGDLQMGRGTIRKGHDCRHSAGDPAVSTSLCIAFKLELRPALYEKTSSSASSSEDKRKVNAQGDYMEVEIYAGIDQHRPSETSVDGMSATKLFFLFGSSHASRNLLFDGCCGQYNSSSSVSGTHTHPATTAMRHALRNEASEMS
ncbi:hypothetical protein SCLCIDRAFT_980520 [Scleroderma citrinum Foug A]|uniref:Uncharacterized protein n=1 Tax=Scleroderma citrinum Foug A TaxID=1036808 RepID=A0A0C3DGF1_9AGAM|nr:hypothetical protein SCLCIDRAFT_980520 [Scleroderma citrinum Foug A]